MVTVGSRHFDQKKLNIKLKTTTTTKNCSWNGKKKKTFSPGIIFPFKPWTVLPQPFVLYLVSVSLVHRPTKICRVEVHSLSLPLFTSLMLSISYSSLVVFIERATKRVRQRKKSEEAPLIWSGKLFMGEDNSGEHVTCCDVRSHLKDWSKLLPEKYQRSVPRWRPSNIVICLKQTIRWWKSWHWMYLSVKGDGWEK